MGANTHASAGAGGFSNDAVGERKPPLWKKLLRGLAVTLLLVAACAFLIVPLNEQTGNRSNTLDFAAYYTAGRIVASGRSRDLYNVRLQKGVEGRASPGGPFLPYYHPPFEALLFAPFALFSYAHAFLLWAALNLVALGGIMLLLRYVPYRLGLGAYMVWLALSVFFVLGALALGQDTLFLPLVFLLGFLALKRRWDFAAGLALGLGIFRFEMFLPFAFIFLLRRRWRLLAGFCCTCTAATVISAAVVGWRGLPRYLRTVFEVGGSVSGPLADRSNAHMMPSLYGVLDGLLGNVVPNHLLFPLLLAGTVALLGWAAWGFKHIGRPEEPAFDLEFSMAVVAALLSSYHVFLSELTPLIVVGFLMLAWEASRPRIRIFGNRSGTVLLLLFLGAVVVGGTIHSQDFSALVVLLLGMMLWMSREASSAH